MDVETSQRLDPLMNGFSSGGNENGAAPPGAADAGVLIDFDPVPSSVAPTENSNGKAVTSNELLLNSFDSLQSSVTVENNHSVTAGKDDVTHLSAVESANDGSHVKQISNHAIIIPDEVLSAPPPPTEDDLQESASAKPEDVGSEVNGSASVPEVVAAATSSDEAKDKNVEKKNNVQSAPASHIKSEPPKTTGGDSAKSKSTAQKSTPAPKASPAGGPAASAAKKTPTPAAAKSTPPASAAGGARTATSASSTRTGTKLAATTKAPRSTSTPRTLNTASADGLTPTVASSPRRTPRSSQPATSAASRDRNGSATPDSRGKSKPAAETGDKSERKPKTSESEDGTPVTPSPGSTPRSSVSCTRSKVGSLDNARHVPGGGNVKIVTHKIDLSGVTSRCGSKDNMKHTPRGGEKKILSQKLEWKAESKIGSLENAKHKPGGGEKKIETKKLEWNAASKVGSLDNAQHKPGGGDKKAEEAEQATNEQ